MAIQRIKFSRKLNFAVILASLAALLVGVSVAQAFDILTNFFHDDGEHYHLTIDSSDFLYYIDGTTCDNEEFYLPFNSTSTGTHGISGSSPFRRVTHVWENHGTITKYSGACGDGDDGVAPGASLACSNVVAAAKFDRYSIQDISFTGNRDISSAGFYLPGVDGMVAIDGLSYDWGTRTWDGTFNTASIPAGEYRGVYLSIFNADGEQFKCLLGKFVVE